MRISKKKYERIIKKKPDVYSASESCTVYQDNKKSDINAAYNTAVQTLRHIQSSGGSLFLGRSRFILWFNVSGAKRRADGSNIYKGIEDALNKIAYYDDIQNQTFDICPGEIKRILDIENSY